MGGHTTAIESAIKHGKFPHRLLNIIIARPSIKLTISLVLVIYRFPKIETTKLLTSPDHACDQIKIVSSLVYGTTIHKGRWLNYYPPNFQLYGTHFCICIQHT